jgi:endonuclease/exonuclease/phosphatase family metal-dependent hydrolase
MLATGENPEITPKIEETLHVLSYNVRLFDLYDWATSEKYENRDSIFSYLKTEQPDVVCFQEFYHQDNSTNFVTRDAIIRFLDIKDYHERYSHKFVGRQNFGVAMLSKYPMISKGDVAFEDEEHDDDNYCIYADIVKGNDTFRIYNVHLQSIKFKRDDYAIFNQNAIQSDIEKSQVRMMIDKLRIAFPKRASQAQRVMEHVETSPYPVIVCGDFNDTPLSYTYNQFNKSLTDAFRNCSSGIGPTYIGRVPAGRIDYIFHSKSLNSMDFKIQEGEYSDHRAVSCRIFKAIPDTL